MRSHELSVLIRVHIVNRGVFFNCNVSMLMVAAIVVATLEV